MKTILFFKRPRQRTTDSIQLLAPLSSKCYVQTIDSAATDAEAAELLRFWKPDGCIVNNDNLSARLFNGIPTIFLHRDPAKLPRNADWGSYDENAIAELAARELLSLGCASFVYVPAPAAEHWDSARRAAFIHALKINGHSCSVVSHPHTRSVVRIQTSLGRALTALPRPIGVFAACDAVAEQVVHACTHAGLSIPDEVAIVGVDNNTGICEMTQPTLTSINCEGNLSRAFYLDLIESRIGNPRLPRRLLSVQPMGIVRRASTQRFQKFDAVAAAACEAIRTRACEGITAREVAATFPCSRRMAEIRFRAATGQSILERIRDERRAAAQKAEGGRPLSPKLLAAQFGYSAVSSVYRLLRQKDPVK